MKTETTEELNKRIDDMLQRVRYGDEKAEQALRDLMIQLDILDPFIK